MPNFDVRDAHGSVITIESSVVGGANRQIVTTALGNSSVMLLNGAGVIGSVTALQGTNPWITRGSISGTIDASLIGMLPAGTQVLGSVATLQGTNPWRTLGSVSGTVDVSVIGMLPGGTNVLGSVATLQGTNPWITLGSVSGTVDASLIGMLPGGTNVVGSVATLQGTNPWVVTNVGSIAVQWQTPSIVGTYAEDAGHTTADKGLFILGVRNDAVASFVSANLEYNAFAHDSAGRVLVKPFAPEESRVEGYASTVNTSQTTLVAAAGAGLRNYVTDVWVANTGAAATLVTFKDGANSVLGYTIAPAGSGSNLQGLTMPIRTGANTTFDFQASTGTSVLYATVKGFKAP